MPINIEKLVAITSHMKILYAEDDAILRENTVAVLSDLFEAIDEANDGREALDLYIKNQDAYDIVITDLNMPHLSGIELIKEIQAINPLQSIIIISAHNETEYFLESIRNSVNGYILKPIDFEQLIDSLYKTASAVRERKENIVYKENLQLLVKEKTDELAENYQKMHEFLTIDKVTQLPNGTMLYHFLENFEKGHELTIMFYNIDNFSFISQSYGYAFADEILRKVAQYLRYNISAEVNLFKYNTDEFVIIFDPMIVNPLSVVIQVETFFKETPIGQYKGSDIYVTLSCGVATTKEPLALLAYGRSALREAHSRGLPSQSHFYDAQDSYVQKAQDETMWIQKFRIALEEDRVIPYFQPIVDNISRKIVKYECLARIEEEGEIIAPIHFLEAARQSGLIGNLTRNMVNKCFKIFAQSDMEFSLNITSGDLLNTEFSDFLVLKQQQYAIHPSRVILEILEDIVINDSNPIIVENIFKLKALGYKLALDDFGNDRSNFARLELLGVDIIKIDGQFIENIDTNPRNQYIVETITTMAHQLHISVVAEFVATKEEYEKVKALGVDFSQGYYFNKPASALV